MDVPRTLVTNDPRAAAEFLEQSGHGAIYKPLRSPVCNLAAPGGTEKWATVFTTKLDAAARERLEDVRFAPCIFQELVPKRFDLRVTVMGNKVFGTEIHSQLHETSATDFRRHYAFDSTPYVAHPVPEKLAEQCRRLNRALGLVFGAYDFVCTPDGRYLFLEVNQQGQFLWLEEMTGQPLLDNFCEMLLQRSADFRCDAPAHRPQAFEPAPPVDEHDVEAAAEA
jgi:glutathione synthase/RimK-type ligase-like ATP-grasp enzyme